MAARVPLPDPLNRGPFSYRAGLAAGATPGRLRGGDLGKPFHGARHPNGADLTIAQRCESYRTVMRPDAFFCSITAAAVMRVPLPASLRRETRLHVAVPHPTRPPEGAGVVGHKVKLMGGDARLWDGLPISTPERLWCELSTVLSMTQLVAAGDYLLYRESPMTSIERLTAAVERFPGRVKSTLRRECLEYLSDGSESPTESELRVVMVRAGITGFAPNIWVQVPGARYRGDLVNIERRMILEYQGEYHFDLEQQRKDMRRIERLRAAGWYVMQINLDDLNDPEELVARIRSVLDSRPVF